MKSTVVPVNAKTINTMIVWNIDFSPHFCFNLFKKPFFSTIQYLDRAKVVMAFIYPEKHGPFILKK